MVSNKLSKKEVLERADQLDFPSSVVEFFQGYLGQPVGGFPEPLRSKIIRDKPRIDGRPGATMEPLDFKKIKAELRSKYGKHITDTDFTSYVMYPKVFDEYQKFIEKYGDLSVVPTRYFLGRPDVGEEMSITYVGTCLPRLVLFLKYALALSKERPSFCACELLFTF